MRSFSSTDLANKTGDVLAAAAQGPVAINRHGKPRFVVLSAEQFERITARGDTRRSYAVADMPADLGRLLDEALAEALAEPPHDH